MVIPNHKRIKISSQQELENWLADNASQDLDVLLVTFSDRSNPSHVSRECVKEMLDRYGWVAGPRYTLNKSLLGHVIRKREDWGSFEQNDVVL